MSYPKPEGVVYQYTKVLDEEGNPVITRHEDSRFTEGSRLQVSQQAMARRDELRGMYPQTEWLWHEAVMED